MEYEYVDGVVVSHMDKKKNVTYEEKEAFSEVDLKNDIIPAGTRIRVKAYGYGYYDGSAQSAVFRVVNTDISKASVKVSAQEFNGNEIMIPKNELVISVGSGKKAVVLEDTDYEILCYNANVNKGKATITIRGLGNYGGTKKITFTINPKSMNYTIIFKSNTTEAKGSMKNASLTEGKSLPSNSFKWSGHSFLGWSYEPDGEVVFANKAKFTNQLEHYGRTIYLYAAWN